jgi:integrase
MSVYRPKYLDHRTGELKEQCVWWYRFRFAGRRIQESSKSTSKTVAKEAEKMRRRELEQAYNGIEDNRQERIRTIAEIAEAYLAAYKVRNPDSATFAEYALRHLTRLLGKKMQADISDKVVKGYQTDRLGAGAAPKSINEEVGFLLRLLEEQGDVIRVKMRREKTLKLKTRKRVARAYSEDEKAAMLAEAKKRRSPHIYPALMLALHCGLRDEEMRELQWGRVDLQRGKLQVGDSKSEAGQDRIIPLNSDVLGALVEHSKWYLNKFGETRPEWYLFPFGQPQPTDPTRPVTTLKTVWSKVRKNTGVAGRWHDNRHTFVTGLAESGEAGDETIRDMAGHVSKQMLKHYSHIGMEAKRRAVAALVAKPAPAEKPEPDSNVVTKEVAKVEANQPGTSKLTH